MRSNIARTESAGSVPVPAPMCRGSLAAGGLAAAAALALHAALLLAALERREEVDECRLLVCWQVAERGHRGGRVLERAADRALLELVADIGEVRTRAVVAVLTDLVAGVGRRAGRAQPFP